ncbi:MAG: type II toxin-antitoxin system Phd/YefM family antitoxin [Alphaproteobacteria bacterium]
MRTVDIDEAQRDLARLVDSAAGGEGFIIAKDGKPLVKVVPLDAPSAREVKRLGFLKGQIKVPDDFDTMFQDEIEEMFYGKK